MSVHEKEVSGSIAADRVSKECEIRTQLLKQLESELAGANGAFEEMQPEERKQKQAKRTQIRNELYVILRNLPKECEKRTQLLKQLESGLIRANVFFVEIQLPPAEEREQRQAIFTQIRDELYTILRNLTVEVSPLFVELLGEELEAGLAAGLLTETSEKMSAPPPNLSFFSSNALSSAPAYRCREADLKTSFMSQLQRALEAGYWATNDNTAQLNTILITHLDWLDMMLKNDMTNGIFTLSDKQRILEEMAKAALSLPLLNDLSSTPAASSPFASSSRAASESPAITSASQAEMDKLMLSIARGELAVPPDVKRDIIDYCSKHSDLTRESYQARPW